MDWTDKLDRADVSREKYACTDPWKAGGHRSVLRSRFQVISQPFIHPDISSDLVKVTGGGPSEPGAGDRVPFCRFRARPHLSVQVGEGPPPCCLDPCVFASINLQ